MTEHSRYDWVELKDFCFEVFCQAGVPADNAKVFAESLIEADLRGVYSHGVMRTEIYLERIQKSMINLEAEIDVIHENEVTALVEGNNNLGVVVGNKALNLALEKAKSKGLAIVGVRGSNHFGTCAYYVKQALEQDIILIAMTNASQTMSPTGGIRPFIGTNPFGVGFPTKKSIPYILDMAPSVVAKGKIMVAAKKNEEIPHGWAVDKYGKSTTNPHEALNGSVSPIGGPKGYGLSMFVDILSGVLTGAGFGQYINNMYENFEEPQHVGHFFIAINIENFMPVNMFKDRLDLYISDIKSEPTVEGVDEILIPGEIEYRLSEEQKKNGIKLPDGIVHTLQEIGEKCNIRFPQKCKV